MSPFSKIRLYKPGEIKVVPWDDERSCGDVPPKKRNRDNCFVEGTHCDNRFKPPCRVCKYNTTSEGDKDSPCARCVHLEE